MKRMYLLNYKTVNMNFLSYKNSISNIALSIFLSTALFHSHATYAMDFQDDEFDLLCNSISSDDLATLRSCEPGEAATLLSILNLVKFPQILNQDFYIKTSVPVNRNLINYPSFQICTYQQPIPDHLFTFHAFYNQTSQKAFTCDEPHKSGNKIGSYLNIQNADYIAALDSAFEILPPEFSSVKNLNFPDIFKLMSHGRFEERRLGIMNHYYQQLSAEAYFEAKIPFFWMVRNLNFTPLEKDQIREQFSAFEGSTFDLDEFAKKHLIFDALGSGTLELSLCKKVFERPEWSFDVGGSLYLPTDYQFARGLYGTYIEPHNNQPIFNLCDLVTLTPTIGFAPDGKDKLLNYVTSAIDQLSSILLQCPLGYQQSLGIGLKLAPYWTIHEGLQFNGIYILELFLPHDQKRFFIPKQTDVPFSEIFAESTLSDGKKLELLEATLTDRLFPLVFPTKVLPGFIIDSTSCLQKSYKKWDFSVGYNGWYQYQEKFLSIKCPNAKFMDTLNVAKSVTPESWSIKLFGKVHRLFTGPRHDMSLALFTDITVYNNSLGNDFTVGLSYDIKF